MALCHRLRNFLIRVADGYRGYAVGLKRLWVRLKPYRDCVKKKLKWPFQLKNQHFFDQELTMLIFSSLSASTNTNLYEYTNGLRFVIRKFVLIRIRRCYFPIATAAIYPVVQAD